MSFIEDYPAIVNVATFLLGLLIAFVGNYVKVITDLNFIKGQLTNLAKIHADFSELAESHGRLESDLNKVIREIDHVSLRVKRLESLGGDAWKQ